MLQMWAIASRGRLTAILLALSACATTQGDLDLPLSAPKNDIENATRLVKNAAIIFVGQARHVIVRGDSARVTYSTQSVATRRQETIVDVVNVLRETVPPTHVAFSCHVWSEPWVPKGVPIELKDEASLTKGPSLFFARKIKAEVVSCAQDLYRSSYPVACGEATINDGVEQQVGNLLLGQGNGCDATRLSSKQYLIQAVQIVNELLGCVAVADRLTHLVLTGTPEIQANACIVESEYVLGQDTCLDALKYRGTIDNAQAEVVEQLIASRDRRDQEIREWLKRDAVRWLEGRTTSDRWRQVDLLRLLCRHRNTVIRDLAKKVLEEKYARQG